MQLVGVLLLGILHGVLLAAVVSILRFLGRVSRPHVAFRGAHAAVRDLLRAEGLEVRGSRIDRRTSVEDIVAAFRPVS